MNGRRWLVFAATAVAVVQIAFLVSMIAGRAAVLRNGQEVMLSVEPVDPRDLLRGDYVMLTYNISRLPVGLLSESVEQDAPDANDRTVFVRLKADEDGIFQPIGARYGEKLQSAPGEGEVDIRGQTRARRAPATQFIFVRYDIERFYVPEGEGKAIERDMRERTFRMKVAVGSDGAAQIKSFHDGDTMLYAEPLY